MVTFGYRGKQKVQSEEASADHSSSYSTNSATGIIHVVRIQEEKADESR